MGVDEQLSTLVRLYPYLVDPRLEVNDAKSAFAELNPVRRPKQP
jgi:hypothetical protein